MFELNKSKGKRIIQPCCWLGCILIVFITVQASASKPSINLKPNFIKGEIHRTFYDGISDDLLTGGLGKTGIGSAAIPTVSNPPETAELRRLAIYSNYRALIDISPGGGYGEFYGPNVTAAGEITDEEGLIAGHEFIAFAGSSSGKENVTLMVQVPDSFDSDSSCIITAPSSGSRGVYGAIGTAGEWGLKRGCAVAYTDKGTGTGAHDLEDNTVNLITGEREDANVAGKESNFTARISDRNREKFNIHTPNRFAFKHAHSQQNPEKDWGKNVLQSIEFAFFVLNEMFGLPGPGKKNYKTILPSNTIVIASSVSNGGGASVRAAEQDKKGLIDGVAVSEPNVNPEFDPHFSIVQGDSEPFFDHSRSLYDYTTLLNVYQGCASLDPAIAGDAPLNFAGSPNICASLREKGLLTSDSLEEQAAEAQQIINTYGILPEQNIVMPSHWFINVPQGVSVTYANTYSRSKVTENLCGYSFGATYPVTGAPVPFASENEATLFGLSNGIPPTAGINLINNLAPGGPKENRMSTLDQNTDGALCLRSFAIGLDITTNLALKGRALKTQRKIEIGIKQIRASGDLHGLPAIFVTGRSDAILPLNHTSRAYFGLNQLKNNDNSNLRYYEVLNAQHLDALNGLPGFNELFIPLHHYFVQAMDIMFDHLTKGTPLPDSQVVRTTPRGRNSDGTVPNISLTNIPAIAADPDPGSRITFENNIVQIPD
jgi:hydroxybutyrate-dimer hydrolase